MRLFGLVFSFLIVNAGFAQTMSADGQTLDGQTYGGQTSDGQIAGDLTSFGLERSDYEVYTLLANGEMLLKPRQFRDPKEPTVYLTFDDGPSPLTEKVLDILKEEQVQGTFFVLGELARLRPGTIRRIVDEGHALGNHTYNHHYGEIYSNFRFFWEQIQQTEEILEEIAGVRPKIIRAPGGTATNFDTMYFHLLDQGGYLIHDWNLDSGDSKYRGVPAEKIIHNIKSAPLKHEMVVLLHDGGGHWETVKALPEIIKYFKKNGYRFAPIDEGVKPIMFRPAKLKWKRTTDYNEFLQFSRMSRDVRPFEAVEPILAHERAEMAESYVPDLEVRIGGREIRFDSSQHFLDDGTFYISVRKIVEQLGGQIFWDDRKKTAYAHLGLRWYVFKVKEKTVLDIQPFSHSSLKPFEMTLRNDFLFVPLRSVVNLWGGVVQDYLIEKDVRQVLLGVVPQRLPLPLNLHAAEKAFQFLPRYL